MKSNAQLLQEKYNPEVLWSEVAYPDYWSSAATFLESHYPELLPVNVNKVPEEKTLTTVNTDHQYSFVSRKEDIDLIRILNEAPKGTPFILVEEYSRDKQLQDSRLFVHVDVLRDPGIQGFPLGNPINPKWGFDAINVFTPKEQKILFYRAIRVYPNSFFYDIKILRVQIDKIKKALNPKNAYTKVSLL